MFNISDRSRDCFMLKGEFSQCGYDWWWHSFTGHDAITQEEKSFFIEFFTCNPAFGQEEPILGQLKENQENNKKPSYLMVKVGTWGKDACQLHRFFGWKNVDLPFTNPFHIKAEDCYLDEQATRGSISVTDEQAKNPAVMCQAGNVSWDLQIHKEIAFNVGYGASKPLRDSEAFEMFWHAEGMKTQYEGEIIWNNRTYIVTPETSYGYADKNWGKDFTSPWVWLSSNHLIDKTTGKELNNSVFDIGGGHPKVKDISLPRKLLSAFYIEGKEYEFNFSKFWTLTKTEFSCEETNTHILWHVTQETPIHKMIAEIQCPKDEMLFVNYEAPNGTKKHNRLWNGGTGTGTIQLYEGNKLIYDLITDHVGCEYGEYSKASSEI